MPTFQKLSGDTPQLLENMQLHCFLCFIQPFFDTAQLFFETWEFEGSLDTPQDPASPLAFIAPVGIQKVNDSLAVMSEIGREFLEIEVLW